MSVRLASSPPEATLFDDSEAELVSSALILLAENAPHDARVLGRLMERLQILNENLLATPSLAIPETLGNDERDLHTLVEHLQSSDGLAGDLDLPLRANLQRSFLLAKIQFFRAFVKAMAPLGNASPELRRYQIELREELAQSIYTQMAEELLLALLRKPTVEPKIKRRAAFQLIDIWDNATLEIDDFCPFLEKAWHARNRVTPDLGSLLGATEYFRLVAEDCSEDFLDYFAREEVSEVENQAFAEFLFGLTWEELQTLRKEMERQSLHSAGEDFACKVLGRTIEHDCDDSDRLRIDPVALYRSYTRRQLAADFRILAGTEGPKRTAEAYLMVYLLDQQKDD